MSPAAEAGALAALVVVPLLPFLDKAIAIDAPVFVAVARQVAAAPLDPFGFDMIWDPTSPHTAEFNRNPPLLSYWLALWMTLFGDSERVLHAALLPFPLLAGLSFLGISRRLGGAGLAPAVLLVTTPAFFVLATTLLLDVPLLACMLFAVYALRRGAEGEGRAGWQWTAGAATAAAGLVKYVGFSTAPLLAAGVLLWCRRPGPALVRVLAPPLALWSAWGVYTASLYGSAHFLGSTDVVTDRSLAPDEFWNQVVSAPIWYGAALVFPVGVWLRALFGRRGGTELAVLGLVLGTFAAYAVIPDGEPSRRAPIELEETVLAALGFAGAFLLWASWLRPSRWRAGPDDRFLLLWLGGLLVFTLFLNWHVNAADALLAAPAALLLLARTPALAPGPRWSAGCAAVGLALSLVLASADAVQNGCYRRAAERFAEEIGDQPGDRWFVGHWGLQHYLEAIGFHAVVPPMYGRSDLHRDDWVASARNISQLDVSANLGRYAMREVLRYECRSWIPLRTTNPDGGGGFYSHHYGYVPWSWSRLPFEVVQLGRVTHVRGGSSP